MADLNLVYTGGIVIL